MKNKEFLSSFNADNHEASVLLDCRPGVNVKNAVWTDLDSIGTLDSKYIGFVEYFDGKNILMTRYSHNLLVGATGKGKSYVYIMNQLELLSRLPESKRPSFVVTDISKGMIYRNLKKPLEERGYRIKVFDFSKPYRSNSFNPMQKIYTSYHKHLDLEKLISKNRMGCVFEGKKYESSKDAMDAAKELKHKLLCSVSNMIRDFSAMIIPNDDPKNLGWVIGARNYCAGLLWLMLLESAEPGTNMTVEKFTIDNLARFAYYSGDGGAYGEIAVIMRKFPDNMSVQAALSIATMRAQMTRDGFISSFTSHLGEYMTDDVAAMTATDTSSDISDIVSGEEPYAIFIVTDESCNCTNTICSMLIDQLLGEMKDISNKRPDKALPRDVLIMADEFCNMPKMPNFVNQITTLRSRRVYMMITLQSMHQLDMVYGEDTRKTIEINCDTQPFLGSNSYETNLNFTKNMGCRIGVEATSGIGNDRNLSITQSCIDAPLVRVSDLAELELGEFYVKRDPERLKTYMLPYFMRDDVPEPMTDDDMPFTDYNPSQYAYDINALYEKISNDIPNSKFDWDF